MRRLLLVMLAAVILLCPARTLPVGKTTVDPNTTRAEAKEPDGADARLAQKVSYEARQKRLCQIADDLTQATGVSIHAGRNKSDWHVRDIPVTVCVKDMPLAKLLDVVVACAHLKLTSERVDGVFTYRLWRTPRLEQELADYSRSRRETGLSMCRDDWDGAVEMAAISDSQVIPQSSEATRDRVAYARDIAKVIAALGSDARDRIMAGEALDLHGNSAPEPLRSALTSFLTATWKAYQSKHVDFWSYGTYSLAGPTQQDVEDGNVVLFMTESGNPQIDGRVEIPVHDPNAGLNYNHFGFVLRRQVLEYLKPGYLGGCMARMEKSMPKPPGDGELAGQYQRKPQRGGDMPCLQVKVKLDAPKDTLIPTFADMLAALSKASGYSIVCEDFESHRADGRANVFGRDTTLGAALEEFRHSVEWYVDEKSKLIVGVALGWPLRHASLVPESLVSRLKAKLEKDGVGLDDAAPIAALTNEQQWEWIGGPRDLASLYSLNFGPARALWAFYSTLSAEDKALARSERGLPLGKFDPAPLAAILKECNTALVRHNRNPYERTQRRAPTDAEAVSRLSIRVTSEDVWMESDVQARGSGVSGGCGTQSISPTENAPPRPGMFRKTRYRIEVIGEADGRTVCVRTDGPVGFPFYAMQWRKTEGGFSAKTVK